MTKVRGLMWGAVVIAAAAWAGVVVTARREKAGLERPSPAKAVPAVEPIPAAAGPTAPPVEEGDVVSRPGVPWGPDWFAGEVPTDELDREDATLRVRLVGDTDREPVEMDVRLWRLGVAESATWTEGDEFRATLRVTKDGEYAVGLPPGRYRLQCLDLRGGADDPPEFVLTSGGNEPVVPVANRRWVRHRLALFDETGAVITRATRAGNGGGSTSGGPPPREPRWAQARRAKLGAERMSGGMGSYRDSVPGPPGAPEDADDSGFFGLGRHRERGDRGRSRWSHVFHAERHAAVNVRADDSIDVDTTFVGLAPRVETLVAQVRRPDGTPIDAAEARVDAISDAIRYAWDPPGDAWRSVPVRVAVTCDGYETLTFDWTAATADARHVLVPKSPK